MMLLFVTIPLPPLPSIGSYAISDALAEHYWLEDANERVKNSGKTVDCAPVDIEPD
jgi:hypothetical protein